MFTRNNSFGTGINKSKVNRNFWTPAQLKNQNVLWFDPNTLINPGGVPSDGSSWVDRNLNYQVTQPTPANRPTPQLNTFNSAPCLNFTSGAFKNLRSPTRDLSIFNSSPGLSVFVATQIETVPGDYRFVCVSDATGVDHKIFLRYNSAGTQIPGRRLAAEAINFGNLIGGPGIVAANEYLITGATHDYTSGNGIIYKNGINLVTNTGQFTLGLSDVGNVNLFIGSTIFNTAQLIGKMSHLIICPFVPTTDIQTKIEGFIAWNSGLVSLLNVNHPYKLAAP